MNELISVVIPVYKVEKYLDRCVNSVLRQTYDHIEIILVDDGSPDNCPTMCDDYAAKYSQVKTYHKPNGGLGSARNYGVNLACGDLILFIDSDDWVEKDYVSHLYTLWKKENVDISITRLRHDTNGKIINKNIEKTKCRILSGLDTMKEVYSHEGIGWTACGKLFKKEVLKQFPFPAGYYEDCAVMYKILFSVNTVAIGDSIFDYHYMSNDGSILKSKLSQKHMRIFEVCDEFEHYINDNCPHLLYLSVLLKRSAVTQMLNRQEMNKKTYEAIFLRFRKEFRKNLFSIMRLNCISFKNKFMYFIHCTFPLMLRILNKMH